MYCSSVEGKKRNLRWKRGVILFYAFDDSTVHALTRSIRSLFASGVIICIANASSVFIFSVEHGTPRIHTNSGRSRDWWSRRMRASMHDENVKRALDFNLEEAKRDFVCIFFPQPHRRRKRYVIAFEEYNLIFLILVLKASQIGH